MRELALKMRSCLRISMMLIVSSLVSGCQPTGPAPAETTSAPAQPATVTPTVPSPKPTSSNSLFRRLPESETGIDFTNRADPNHPMSRLYHSGFVTGGVAIGDLNGDQRPDLFFTSGPDSNRLYLQTANFKFEDATEKAGVGGGTAWGAGANLIDIDNDGDLDIYVCNYATNNQLFINQGNGQFTEQAEPFGIGVADASLVPAFCDYDCDGDLDLYIVTLRYYREGGRPTEAPIGMRNGKPYVLPKYDKYYALKRQRGENGRSKFKLDSYGREDRLYRNNGNGSFVEVTEEAGITGPGFGLSATWWDYNEDGWPDLYVCNDFDDPDVLYHNNGDGTFRNTLEKAVPHTPWFSMGSDAADLNNDGRLDLFVVDMSATNHFKQKTTMGAMNAEKLREVAGPPAQYMRNSLFINTGTGRFQEAAFMAGLANTDWSWAAKLADFDNDGWVDVFIGNGIIRSFNDSDVPFDDSMLIGRTIWDVFKNTPPRREQNLAFRNRGQLDFQDVSQAWGLDHVGVSYGAAYGDLDQDGDLDLIVVNLDEPVSVYQNQTKQKSIRLKLVGSVSNRNGIGAEVRLETEEGVQLRQLQPMTGFLSCNESTVHFGVGNLKQIRQVTVRWPSGVRQSLQSLAPGMYEIREDQANTSTNPLFPHADNKPIEPLFVADDRLNAFPHVDPTFNDFEQQPLLPNRLSQFGPGMAWSDIDNDGDEDVFLGGGTGQAGRVLLNQQGNGFSASPQPALERDAMSEDMGALWVDIDQDDDLDLYVASGSVEAIDHPARFEDRLYFNDGKGILTRASSNVLPSQTESSGVVTACDFDRDGDLDLFVGGRLIPGQYPLPPQSRLLVNQGGTFQEATPPALQSVGMVTSALWSDTDGDGWSDLLLTCEWGPIRLFRNVNGQLKDQSKTAGLSSLLGWWNGIAARDLDGDRDIDYVVTNFGLNTKYHAKPDQPALLYFGDFEKSGRKRLIEAEFESETLFPIRGKSCSTHAMPFLSEKFATYRAFAAADLADLYSSECLEKATRFAANQLESGVLLNDGSAHFTFQPLPRIAQIAPAFGVVISEFNGDAAPDVYLVHNFFGPQPETGNMDGGISQLLYGGGDGSFRPVTPSESGTVVAGDAKSLAMADLNQDGRQDLIVGLHDSQPISFIRSKHLTSNIFQLQLEANSGNSQAIGARVTVILDDGSTQTAEVAAGGSYLSQSNSTLSFGLNGKQLDAVEVIWPNGDTTRTEIDEAKSMYKIVYTRVNSSKP